MRWNLFLHHLNKLNQTNMKTLYKTLMFIWTFLILGSCATIPASTSVLSKEIIKEANGMHDLNTSLINQLYTEREQRINDFITHQYTPAIINNYEQLLPDSLDYKAALPHILQSILPVINKKRDSLQGILRVEQQNILRQLNANYASYTTSTAVLQGLIDSAVKLKSSESTALMAIENLAGVSQGTVSNIDLKLEKLLKDSGRTVDQLLQIANSLKK
jgi:hypothetical protein